MSKSILLASVILLFSAAAYSQPTTSQPTTSQSTNPPSTDCTKTTVQANKADKNSDNLLNLDTAICLAKAAVVEAQARIAQQQQGGNSPGPGQRPSLSSAEFDFQTIVPPAVPGSLSLWVVTIGGEKTKAVTNEIDFVYPPLLLVLLR